MKKKEKKNNLMLIFGVLLIAVFVSVGYAALTANLQINGQARMGAATWKVKFDNIRQYDAANNVTLATSDQPHFTDADMPTTVVFGVPLKTPGDKYEFAVDVKNEGSIDAKLDSHTLSETGRNDVLFTVKELDNDTASDIDWTTYELPAGTTKTLLVSVIYDKDNVNPALIGTTSTITLSLTMNFVQK